MPDEGSIKEINNISHSLVGQLFQGVVVIQNDCLVYASPGMPELTGFTFDELCGSSFEETPGSSTTRIPGAGEDRL